LAARKAEIARQLDLLMEMRGPVAQLRSLVADLDRIADDLADALRQGGGAQQRQDR
jgi:hypothetical protein